MKRDTGGVKTKKRGRPRKVQPLNDDSDFMVHYTENEKNIQVMANKIARRASHPELADELFVAGLSGLMEAHQKFEKNRGLKFWTYACPRVRGAMLDWLRGQDVVPRLVRSMTRQRKEMEEKLRTTDEETIQKALGWTRKQYIDSFPMKAESVDKVLFETDGGRVQALKDLAVSCDPECKTDFIDRLKEAFRGLSATEITIIRLYWFEGETMKVIGEWFGLSESRVSQIHSQILARLRSRGESFKLDLVGRSPIDAKIHQTHTRPHKVQSWEN